MYRKIIAITVLAAMLAGCAKSGAEGSKVTSAEVTAAEVSETESVTTTVTLDTVIYCNESVFEENGAAAEKMKSPTVVPADEEYDVYPMKILYPENAENDFSVDAAVINEEFKNGEFVINKFSAEYPVFGGGDKAVTDKINGYIKNYVDGIYDELKEDAESYVFEDWFDPDGFPYNLCGFLYERSFNGGYGEKALWDVNGNILSVYFEDYEYGAGAMHGYETPTPMVFDLRNGERVDFNKLVGDADGLSEVLSKTLSDYRYHDTADNYAEYNQKRINDGFVYDSGVEFGFDDEGDYVAAHRKANDRMTVHSGCLCFYLAPYEYGCYADGIRRVDVPVKDVLSYLNDEGKALFEGYVSAESVPADIIVKNGEKYFDKGEKREERHLVFSDKPGRS